MPRWGKGRCGGARSTLFAPVGQRRFRVGAPDFGGFTGESALRAVCLSGRADRRAGGTGGTQSARDGNTRITDENAPFPDRTFLFTRPRRRPSCSPSRDCHIFPRHPAGRTAGSARTRSRDSSLENPFLGTASAFPRSRPSNAAGGKPLLVGLPPSTRAIAPSEPKRSNPAPFVTGRGCVNTEPKALAPGTAGALPPGGG